MKTLARRICELMGTRIDIASAKKKTTRLDYYKPDTTQSYTWL